MYDRDDLLAVVEAAKARAVLAERERIAREIEADACVVCQKAGRAKRGSRHNNCAYWFAAARIVRGQA